MKYKKPAATVDLIVEREEKILLIKRKHKPFKDMWALPGGYLECEKETLEEAGIRELKEETGLVASNLILLNNYSDPKRDPRGHVISHAYIVKEAEGDLIAGDDAADTRFFSLDDLPDLAFDHERILQDYLKWKN